MSTRDDRFHVGLDMRGIPAGDWPKLGQMAGLRHQGQRVRRGAGLPALLRRAVEPRPEPGRIRIVRATPDMVAAIVAAREDYYRRNAGNGGAGGCYDHDTAQAGVCLEAGAARPDP